MKILLAEHSIVNGKNAGSKARLDVLDILRRNGYIHVPLYSSKTNKVVELLSIIGSSGVMVGKNHPQPQCLC